jgi:hypothetical protein
MILFFNNQQVMSPAIRNSASDEIESRESSENIFEEQKSKDTSPEKLGLFLQVVAITRGPLADLWWAVL